MKAPVVGGRDTSNASRWRDVGKDRTWKLDIVAIESCVGLDKARWTLLIIQKIHM